MLLEIEVRRFKYWLLMGVLCFGNRGSSVQILASDGGVMLLLEIEIRQFKYWLLMGVLCCWK